MTTDQTHVLVIEHRQQTADQISRLLGFESDLNVVGQAPSVEEAVALMDTNEVEVILLGGLGDGSGLDMAAKLQEAAPNVQIIRARQNAFPAPLPTARCMATLAVSISALRPWL